MSVDSIANTMLEIGRIQSEGAQRTADIQARAQAANGQIWGSTIAQLGQIPGQVFQQQQAQKEQALKSQITQAQLDSLKRAQAGEAQANAIVAGLPRNPDDNTFDVGALTQKFAQSGVPLDQQERLLKSLDAVNGVIKSWNDSTANHRAELADTILKQHKDGEPVTGDTVQMGIATAKSLGLATPADEQKFTQALAGGADPQKVLETIRGMGCKQDEDGFIDLMDDTEFNMVEVADGIADLIYVALGAALEFGIDIEPIFNEVHRSNMSKAWSTEEVEKGLPDGVSAHEIEGLFPMWCVKRADGKILKSPSYSPANVRKVLDSLMEFK